MLDPSEQTSIPLVQLSNDPDPKFILNPKALQIIQSYSHNHTISFISICGDYRSGKSFLMNSLFFSKEGFKVSPTTEPCTKGINMWTKPIPVNGKNVWILDTEGFGATDRDESHDVKIFLLTTLLSSIVMYNSFGALDQNTINKLAGICLKARQMDSTLARIKMFWILRDFSLKMQTKQGRQLTPDEYLSEALDDSVNKEQRSVIKKVFAQRYCIPLVRPVIDETVLSQLNEIKFEELRGEFVEEIYKLRKKMLATVDGKAIQGMGLSEGNLGLILARYLEMLNNNEIDTCVSSTWDSIVSHERQKLSTQITDKIRQMVNTKLQTLPLTNEQLQNFTHQLASFTQNEMKFFRKHFRDETIVKETEQEMSNFGSELVDSLRVRNGERVLGDGKIVLKGIFDGLEKGLGREISGDAQAVMKYIEKVFRSKDDFFSKFGKFINGPCVIRQGGNNKSTSQVQKTFKIPNHLPSIVKLLYYQQFYTQQKHLMFKLMGQFSQEMATVMAKLNEQKKLTKRLEGQAKQLRQEKQTLSEQVKTLEDKLIVSQRSLTESQKLCEIKQHEIQAITTNTHNEYLQLKNEYEQNIDELKDTILALEKNFMTLKKQTELEKTQHDDKIKYLNERHDMAINKLEQSRVMNEKALEQVREQYEDKLKRAEEKYQELHNQLLSERKKFTELNKSKKEEESQLMEDLAEKNEKLLNLRREFANVEHCYKQQLETIIREQKNILANEFALQLEERHHQLAVYEQKLEQCMIRLTQLEDVDRKYEKLLVEHRALEQDHQLLALKHSELVNRVKKNGQLEKEREELYEEMKEKYSEELRVKEDELKNFKLQLRQSEEEHSGLLNEQEQKHREQISKLKEELSQKLEEKINFKVTSLQTAHKDQRNQLHQQLKDCYEEVEQLKLASAKMSNQQAFAKEIAKKLICQYQIAQKHIRLTTKKYQLIQANTLNSQVLQVLQASSQLQTSQLDISMINDSSITNPSLRELSQQLQSLILPLLIQSLAQTDQLQDLKHSFKQTVGQLEQCQTHIHSLNAQINQQQATIKALDEQLVELKLSKLRLSEIQAKLQDTQKQNQLLKNQVQVRDQIYNKREISIKENLQLYKETIANLTEENQHLSQKTTKLQIQLNRFTDWQNDFLIPSKTKSNMSSLEYIDENQQDDDEFSMTQKLQQLNKQNRKLKKQLHHQQELSLLTAQQSRHPSNLLSNVLLDSNHTQLIEALKKENSMYKQRVEELRERELRLIEEVKLVKQSEKLASDGKMNMLREEFDGYRRKAKEEMQELEQKVEQLNDEKYKLKQEILLIRQQDRSFASCAKELSKSIENHQKTQKTSYGLQIANCNSPRAKIHQDNLESLYQTIESLKNENLKIQSQLTAAHSQITRAKDDADRKLASLQVGYEERIRQLEAEKARVELQNEKNKTKYEHLLRVNNDLMVEVDTFKARANNQMTLKEKYKHKISSLFMDD